MVLYLFRYRIALLLVFIYYVSFTKHVFAQLKTFDSHQQLDLVQSPVRNLSSQPLDNEQHFLGSWFGGRTWLIDQGINLAPTYMLEAAGNVSGGITQGAEYVGRFGLNAEIDWQKIAGIQGLKTHSLVIIKSGRDLSNDRLGRDPYSVTELYGSIGTLVKLQFTYMSQDLMNRKIQLGLGRMSQALFFDTSPLYCNFLSLALCAVPRVLPGANFTGFYNSAKTNWGSYFRIRPVTEIYFQIGAFEASPMHGGHSGFNWSSNRDIGVNIPFQLGWEPEGNTGEHPAHVVLGGYYDSSPLPDIYWDKNGQPISLTGKAGRINHGHTAFWMQLDYMLWRNSRPVNTGMVVFGNFTNSDPNLSAFCQQATIGFENAGQIHSRPEDGFGMQVTYAWVSNHMKQRQREYKLLHGTYLKGLYGFQSHEMIIEAQYSFHLYRGLDIQPDLQYIIHPNSQAAIRNAVVLAGRTRINF